VREADSTLAYARTVLMTTFIDAGRRAFRRRELLVADPRTALAVPDEPGQADLRLAVLTALGELPPRQRAVVVLRHWFDLDVATTSRELGCSEGTVKSQTAKALMHLRTRLGSLITLEETP
jgi:RNA polymerase sigma factor (sigma-70 family)